MESFGETLYNRILISKDMLFEQGRMAELTFQAYAKFIQFINDHNEETISITYPVGVRANKSVINDTAEFSKLELVKKYEYLQYVNLPTINIFQLVTIIESLLGDILKITLTKFPLKIPNKKKVDVDVILKSNSLDEIKMSIINYILNEISYKSPKDFSEEFNKYVGINLFEKPTYHKYVEIKATRDIHIHNSGIANEIYFTKADKLSRVRKISDYLPVTIDYFLDSYECCLQLTEILEEELNNIWPSIRYQTSVKTNTEGVKPDNNTEKKINKSKENMKDSCFSPSSEYLHNLTKSYNS